MSANIHRHRERYSSTGVTRSTEVDGAGERVRERGRVRESRDFRAGWHDMDGFLIDEQARRAYQKQY